MNGILMNGTPNTKNNEDKILDNNLDNNVSDWATHWPVRFLNTKKDEPEIKAR